MNRKLLGLILSAVFISVCVGCGAENTTKEQAETDSAIIIEEGTPETLEEVTETSEETLEPTLGVTEEPSEETTTETDIETPTIESTETVVPEHGEEPIPEPQAIYTYTDMSATMYAQQTVNVRDLPDVSIANDRMFFVIDNFFIGNITDAALINSLSALELGKQYVAVTQKGCDAGQIIWAFCR